MIRRIIYLAFVVVTLVGCSKVSVLEDGEKESVISFTAYTNMMARGPVIGDADDLRAAAHFKVGVYEANSANVYIPFKSLGYDDSKNIWRYYDTDGEIIKYYWPVGRNLTFAAHYPTDELNQNFGYERYEYNNRATDPGYFVFNYTVNHDTDKQDDVLYALLEDQKFIDPVNLHFKHALTQIDFMGKLDPDLEAEGINITVYGVEVHNVRYTGDFYVYNSTDGVTTTQSFWDYAHRDPSSSETQEWDAESILISEFDAPMRGDGNGIDLSTTEVDYTDTDGYKVLTTSTKIDKGTPISTGTGLMLMPQTINAWNPAVPNSDITKTGAYLAISCEITQRKSNGSVITIHHKENYIYVPLVTKANYGDSYGITNKWRAGYKITYRLLFGGGYSTPPGKPNPVVTLTPMTVTTDVNSWNVITPPVEINF